MRITVLAGVAVVLMATLGAAAAGSQSARATGAISGAVTDALTGRPVADAIVSLAPEGVRAIDARRQLTDGQGRFVFTELAADRGYALTVARAGYFDGAFGRIEAPSPHLTPIALADGQWFDIAQVRLWRPASISGTVLDEGGQPVAGVFVRLLSQRTIGGRSTFVGGPFGLTDDGGRYRLSHLPPGRYSVMVPSSVSSIRVAGSAAPAGLSVGRAGHYPMPPSFDRGRARAYPVTFHGGATTASSAATIDLEPGAARSGVDVVLQAVAAVRVSGTVQAPPVALTNLVLRLLPGGLEELGLGSECATALVGADGRFTFLQVPAGEYVLDAPLSVNGYRMQGPEGDFSYGVRPPRPPGMPAGGSITGPVAAPFGTMLERIRMPGAIWFARVPIAVEANRSEDVTVVVPLSRAASMRGRIVVEADPNSDVQSAPASVLTLETATGSARHGSMITTRVAGMSGDEFAFDGILPGRYVLRTSSSTWSLRSVTIAGRDHDDMPVEFSAGQSITDVVVTVTNAVQTVFGTVRAASNVSSSGAAVIVFPVAREQWTGYGLAPRRIRSVRTSTTGTYTVSGLPAGDYFIVAVAPAHSDAWLDPDFLDRASRTATRVTIAWSGQRRIDLSLSDTIR